MYRFFNKLNKWRNNKRRKAFYEKRLRLIYLFRNVIGYCRGFLFGFTGKIKYENVFRPLIIGSGTQLMIEPGCSIVLKNESESSNDVFPNNQIFLSASTIGTRPHYLALDPPAQKKTRIELLEHAELVLEKNTIILSGGYISGTKNTKIIIGKNTYISQEVRINSRNLIQIGKNVLIGYQVIIMDYDAHIVIDKDDIKDIECQSRGKAVVIGDNVWIGAKATILKGVNIGSGSIIGANSCVVSDVPANSIAVGNPARIIRNNVTWQR